MCIALALTWRPPHARADDALEDALHVEPGATCVRTNQLIEHIETWLGASPLPSALTIKVHGSALFARVVWFEVVQGGVVQAERRFEPGPARCEDLHAALGLTIALAIKASLLETAPGLGHDVTQREWTLGVDGLFATAIVPGLAGGIAVHATGALTRSLLVRAGALALHGPDGTLQRDDSRMRAWLFAGRLELCVALATWRDVQVAACVGALIGQLWGRGHGFDTERSTRSFFCDLIDSLRMSWALSARWSVQLALGVAIPLVRTRFVVREPSGLITDARELAALGGFVALGPAYRF